MEFVISDKNPRFFPVSRITQLSSEVSATSVADRFSGINTRRPHVHGH